VSRLLARFQLDATMMGSPFWTGMSGRADQPTRSNTLLAIMPPIEFSSSLSPPSHGGRPPGALAESPTRLGHLSNIQTLLMDPRDGESLGGGATEPLTSLPTVAP
jgi:hypothetical protein